MMIGYARVSTDDQTHNLQLDALAKAGCERVHTETASGSRLDRPELAKAIASLRPGDTLVVWKLDRLGRTVHQLIDLVRALKAAGAAFRSLSDPIDTTTPAGRLFFHIMAALAEMERDLIRERTNAGLTAARARGRVGGRRPKLTPHQIEQARRLMADPSESAQRVADTFGINRTTLYRLLRKAADTSLNLPKTIKLTDMHAEARRIFATQARAAELGQRDLAQSAGASSLALLATGERTGTMGTTEVIYDTEERLFDR